MASRDDGSVGRACHTSRMTSAALLLLADGRFPAGGHAHSGGLEIAAADGAVHDLATLAAFLRGRLHTTGLVQAALAAAACGVCRAGGGVDHAAALRELDAEADARHPAPVSRRISRAQGRAVLRAGRAVWPHALLDGLATHAGGPHHAVAFGAVAAAAGVDPASTATATALASVTGPATAAVRLLGLDPYGVHATLAGMAGEVESVAGAAAAAAAGSPERLPAATAPRLDIDAVRHEQWEVRLFAS